MIRITWMQYRRLCLLTIAALTLIGCAIAPTPPPVAPAPAGTLAYIRDGDIWTQTLPDGDPVRITTDGGCSAPVWSSTGRWLAFRQEQAAWVVDAAGEIRHRLDGPVTGYAWSPVDDRLAWVDAAAALRLGTPTAGGLTPTTLIAPETGGISLGSIAWSPDGQWIAYEVATGLGHQGLWRIAATGGKPHELHVSGVPETGPALPAGWTADGQSLLFWQSDMLSASVLADGVPLYRLSLEGGAPIQLAEAVLYRPGFVVPAPTGDGRVALVSGSGRGTWTNKALVVADGTGDAATLTPADQAATSPAWSPDGSHLAYSAMPDRGDLVGGDTAREGLMQRRIWMVGRDGGDPRQLTADPAWRDEAPRWSADGAGLIFARMNAEGETSLWWMAAAGGEPVVVVPELGPLPGPAEPWFGYYGTIDWSAMFDWSTVSHPDAAAYAETTGVSPDEASRRLALQDAIGELNAELREQEPATFAGLWLEHEPDFRVTVRFTRRPRRTLRRYVRGGPLEAIVEPCIADASLLALENIQRMTMILLDRA